MSGFYLEHAILYSERIYASFFGKLPFTNPICNLSEGLSKSLYINEMEKWLSLLTLMCDRTPFDNILFIIVENLRSSLNGFLNSNFTSISGV